MEIDLTDVALKDLKRHKVSGNKSNCKKIEKLLNAIAENPYDGIGQPEQLRYELTGKSSRKINGEHRIVYSIDEEKQIVTIHSMYGHYLKQ